MMTDLNARLSVRPLYIQVRDALVQKITGGDWRPGAALPNETQLAQSLGISIGTVRKALDMMEIERIVTRRQGRGTFVNDYASSDTPFPFSTIRNSEGKRVSGERHGRSVTRVQASVKEAKRLGVRPDDELIRVDRSRSHNRLTFMVETCLLPAKHFRRLPEELGRYRLSVLAQQNSILLGHADEKVDIVPANEADARELGVPELTPLLRLDRVIFSDNHDALEWRVGRCFLRHLHYTVQFT